MNAKILTLIVVLFPLLLNAQWSNDPSVNTPIMVGSDSYVQPKVVIGPDGGSYISWFSEESGTHDFYVYLQRLDVHGNKLWDEDGLLVSNHPTDSWTTDYGLAMDQAGNAVIVNRDQRTGLDNIYAWCISPEGNFIWGSNGVSLSDNTEEDYSPEVLIDQENNAVVMWEAFPLDTNLFIKTKFQKIGPDGTLLWDDVVIENDSAHCWMPRMINTEDSCTLVIWVQTDRDTSHAVGNYHYMFPYMQKIDPDGNFVWPEPVQLNYAYDMPLFPFVPSLDTDGEGGAFVSWMGFPDFGEFYTCYVQYVTSDGSIHWAQNGINVTDSTQFLHTDPVVLALSDGEGVIVFWNESRPRSGTDVEVAVMGQRFSMDGERIWTTQGKVIDGFYNELDTASLLMDVKPVGNNEALVFYDHKFISMLGNDTIFTDYICAKRIDQDANPIWNNPSVISNNYGEVFYHDISGESNDQWILAWCDNRNDPQHDFKMDIYAQNMGPEGWIGPLSYEDIAVTDREPIQLYPNPARDMLRVQFEMERASTVEIALYDLMGKQAANAIEIYKGQGRHEVVLNTGNLSPGIYFVSFWTPDIYTCRRFVKN